MAVTFQVKLDGVDISANIGSFIRITYGRQEITSNIAQASTATVDLVWGDSALGLISLPGLTIGRLIEVFATHGASGTSTIFSGRITDVVANAGSPKAQVIAVNNILPAIQRTPVTVAAATGTTGTLCTNILTAVISAAGLTGVSVVSNTGGNVQVSPGVTAAPAQSLLSQLLDGEFSGTLCEVSPLSVGVFVTSDRNIDTMPSGQKFNITATTSYFKNQGFRRGVGDILNQSVVSWTGGTETFTDASSVSLIGLYSRQTSTLLSSESEAEAVAALDVTRQVTPGFRAEVMPVRWSAFADGARKTRTDNCRVGTYLTTASFGASFPSTFFIEGWTDVITAGPQGANWERQLIVSASDLTKAPEVWSSVTNTLTWATVPGTIDWLDMTSTSL